MNKLTEIAGLLKPIAEQDWHGKWRIQKVLELCQSKHPDNNMHDGVKYITHVQTGTMGGSWHCSICGPNYCELDNNIHKKDDQRTKTP